MYQIFKESVAGELFYDLERSLFDRTVDILHLIASNRRFYRNAIKSDEFLRAWNQAALEANVYYVGTYLRPKGLSEDDVEMAAFLMTVMFVGAVVKWVQDDRGRTAEEYARAAVEYAWGGLSSFTDGSIVPPGELGFG